MAIISTDELDRVLEIVDDYRDGLLTADEIAEKYGLTSRQQMYHLLDRWNVERDRTSGDTTERRCARCEILLGDESNPTGKVCDACYLELSRGIRHEEGELGAERIERLLEGEG